MALLPHTPPAQGCKSTKAVTILLRGANDYMLDEMDRSIHDSLCVVKRVLESGTVVPGTEEGGGGDHMDCWVGVVMDLGTEVPGAGWCVWGGACVFWWEVALDRVLALPYALPPACPCPLPPLPVYCPQCLLSGPASKLQVAPRPRSLPPIA